MPPDGLGSTAGGGDRTYDRKGTVVGKGAEADAFDGVYARALGL